MLIVTCLDVGSPNHVTPFFACYESTIHAISGVFDKAISCRKLLTSLMHRVKLKRIEACSLVTISTSTSYILNCNMRIRAVTGSLWQHTLGLGLHILRLVHTARQYEAIIVFILRSTRWTLLPPSNRRKRKGRISTSDCLS